jgi:anti-sigma regulatory factor (Ser/Thr protein kinase)
MPNICGTHLRGMHSQTMMSSRRLGTGSSLTTLRDQLVPGREWTQMTAVATGASESAEDLAMMASATVIGSLTIAARPEMVGASRSFVAKALGEADPATDVAVLLASEIVTNAVLHSNSRRAGGTVTITAVEMGSGVRIDVADEGSERSIPEVKGQGCVTGGHGLLLVQTLADQWGYLRDELGTRVWFWLVRGRGYDSRELPG